MLLFVGLALASYLMGCGGARTLRGNTYQDPEATYLVGTLDPEWRELSGVEGRNDLAWVHDDLAAIIQINASCDPALDIPLTALTNHLLFGFTERVIKSQRTVPMSSREALETHVQAKLDGVPRELLLYVLKKNGCVYDFSLVAPPGQQFAEAKRSYGPFVAAFKPSAPQRSDSASR